MFKELAPLVRHRAVLFTVSHVEDDQFRVNVIPKKIADGENDALTTPVSVTGTVEDLDKELPGGSLRPRRSPTPQWQVARYRLPVRQL